MYAATDGIIARNAHDVARIEAEGRLVVVGRARGHPEDVGDNDQLAPGHERGGELDGAGPDGALHHAQLRGGDEPLRSRVPRLGRLHLVDLVDGAAAVPAHVVAVVALLQHALLLVAVRLEGGVSKEALALDLFHTMAQGWPGESHVLPTCQWRWCCSWCCSWRRTDLPGDRKHRHEEDGSSSGRWHMHAIGQGARPSAAPEAAEGTSTRLNAAFAPRTRRHGEAKALAACPWV
mmetsp:Transcript_4594/g.15120  ORF Transcript_4594/g.15120 Transcript_4594/m.15120 type:complete len:234 (+) Transcript_4594:119-820(+)